MQKIERQQWTAHTLQILIWTSQIIILLQITGGFPDKDSGLLWSELFTVQICSEFLLTNKVELSPLYPSFRRTNDIFVDYLHREHIFLLWLVLQYSQGWRERWEVLTLYIYIYDDALCTFPLKVFQEMQCIFFEVQKSSEHREVSGISCFMVLTVWNISVLIRFLRCAGRLSLAQETEICILFQ